jgi:hypothetical protein
MGIREKLVHQRTAGAAVGPGAARFTDLTETRRAGINHIL